MKFIWLQDMDIMSEGGGAQLTDRRHFIEGLRRGHDLQLVTPKTGEIPLQCDAFIVSNATAFHVDVLRDLAPRSIWFIHDYFPACKYRLFYPMRESCKSCYLKERWLPILLKAKLIIWLSPLHRQSFLWLYPELEGVPYHLAPSPVDSKQFYDLKIPRQGVVAVESLAPFKGREHVLKWAVEHPEVPVTFIGNPEPEDGLPPNCRVHGPLHYSVMNEVYNRHEALLHLPQSPSPFDRTVAEAFLAGCKIIGNELIGALSWSFFKEGREAVAKALRESPTRFWERIEEIL